MSSSLPLPEHKKLKVIYRVEPGCLGPTGADKIEGFCVYVQESIKDMDADYVSWEIVPRNDKKLPEMQFQLVGKNLSHSQAHKYLAALGKELEEFETHLVEKLADLIDEYMRG